VTRRNILVNCPALLQVACDAAVRVDTTGPCLLVSGDWADASRVLRQEWWVGGLVGFCIVSAGLVLLLEGGHV
jgi:hypothetical protein